MPGEVRARRRGTHRYPQLSTAIRRRRQPRRNWRHHLCVWWVNSAPNPATKEQPGSPSGKVESVMTMSANRLPDQFPIGTKYVVEGRGGGDGNLRVFSRYIVMPDGRRIDLPADFARRGAAAGAVSPEPQWPPEVAAVSPLAPAPDEKTWIAAGTFRRPRGCLISAGRSPPAPHPQSPGVEPRPPHGGRGSSLFSVVGRCRSGRYHS